MAPYERPGQTTVTTRANTPELIYVHMSPPVKLMFMQAQCNYYVKFALLYVAVGLIRNVGGAVLTALWRPNRCTRC